MSIANEIQRIRQAKEDIVAALKTKGIRIQSGDTLDEFAEQINPYWEDCVKDTSVDWSTQYLTFKALEDGTFTLTMPSGLTFTSISYSTDNGNTWTTTNYDSSNGVTITTPTITSGNKVLWKGVGNAMGTKSIYSYFSSTNNFTINGNIMSLLYGDNFSEQTSLTVTSYSFRYLFQRAIFLISAVNFILPATTLASYCYANMFSGCTSLTIAPNLPATTLESYCYANMFDGCTSLTIAPSSIGTSTTTMATSACTYMFRSCTSLTIAPNLPATTLESYCYAKMFSGCTSLTIAPNLPATTLASYCYANMFSGCTRLTIAPNLPATTLVSYCYRYMFNGCTRLNYIKAMFTTTPSSSYMDSWVTNVASRGTFVKNSAATWNVTGTSGIPSGWTVETASS